MSENELNMRDLAKAISTDLRTIGLGVAIDPNDRSKVRSTEDLLLDYFKVFFDKAPNTKGLLYYENSERRIVQFDIETANPASNINAKYVNTFQCRLDEDVAAVRHEKITVSLDGRPPEGLQIDMYPVPGEWKPLDPFKMEQFIKQKADAVLQPLIAAGYTDERLNSLNDNHQSLTDQMIAYMKVIDQGVMNKENLPVMKFPDDSFGFITLKSKGSWNEQSVKFIHLFEFNSDSVRSTFQLTNIAVRLPKKAPKVERVFGEVPRPSVLIDSVLLDITRNRKQRNRNPLSGKAKSKGKSK